MRVRLVLQRVCRAAVEGREDFVETPISRLAGCRSLPRRRLGAGALSVIGVLIATAQLSSAQGTTPNAGVRLQLAYERGTKPTVAVIAVPGEVGDSLEAMLARDWRFGGRINVAELKPSDTEGATPRAVANYGFLRRLGVVALVQATVGASAIEVSVHNTVRETVERTARFSLVEPTNTAAWRMQVHAVADQLELWISGVKGIAATRILYVAAGKLWQIDSDGANAILLADAEHALSPVWSPHGDKVAYVTLGRGGSRIAIREASGETRTLETPPGGLNITPAFTPDGSALVYAHGAEAGVDLYATMLGGTSATRRLTIGRGSDNTQPSLSADGRRVAYTTNRTGRPEVFVSDADGTNAELFTDYFEENAYRANPDWSPDGRLIAFEARTAGQLQIVTMGLRDRVPKRHTSEGANEQPAWAPDSRHLVITSTRGGTKQLWVLDTESGEVRQLTHSLVGARFGAWSRSLGSAP